MSATQIMAELPKLTREERKQIIEEAMDLNYDAAEREAVEWAEACAAASFQMLDEMEAADAAKN
jgi:heme oxygenase